MPNGDNILPEYEGKPTEKLWKEYASLHEINPEKRINKPVVRKNKDIGIQKQLSDYRREWRIK